MPISIMLRGIAVIGKWCNNQIPLHPVPILPRNRLSEPHLIINPVRLKHISCQWHIKVVLRHIWCTYPFTDRHTLRLRSSNPALPYISRFLLFNLLTLPSTIPFVHLYLIAFRTASQSILIPLINDLILPTPELFACITQRSSTFGYDCPSISLNEIAKARRVRNS